MLLVNGTPGRDVLHQLRANLRGGQRPEWRTEAGRRRSDVASSASGHQPSKRAACELAAVFLLPFVAIRLVADRESGALKLEMQQSIGSFARIAAKAIVLLAGWLVAMPPPLSAILLLMNYGGSVYPPELITLTFGHLLNAGLTIARRRHGLACRTSIPPRPSSR